MNRLDDTRKEKLLEKLKAWHIDTDALNLEAVNLAFVHTSYAIEHHLNTNNQRLEFLGDAVLDLVVAQKLYAQYPEEPEGYLTKIRAMLVCERNLAKTALSIGMDELLLLGHGEELGGGRQRASNLEDCFEAFCGALYLEKGLTMVENFIANHLWQDSPTLKAEAFDDYKTMLQEVVQKKPNQKVHYKLIETEGPDHNKRFHSQVMINQKTHGAGWGKSKKESERKAAQVALRKMGVLKNTKGES